MNKFIEKGFLLIVALFSLFIVYYSYLLNEDIGPMRNDVDVVRTKGHRIFDIGEFDFSVNCNKIFTQKPNNKRDVIFYAMQSNKASFFNNDVLFKVSQLTRKAVPNARIILFVVNGLPSGTSSFRNKMESLNIEVIEVEQPVEGHIISVRFFVIKKYLEEHKSEFDRVILADARDAGLFGDFFATFTVDDMGWLSEQYGKQSNQYWGPSNLKLHYKWFKSIISTEFAEYAKNNSLPCINAGFGYGGIDKMYKFITTLTENMELDKLGKWGYEQTMMNYLYYYTDKLKDINMKLERCSDTICYYGEGEFIFDGEMILYNSTKCPPVAFHKIVTIGRTLVFERK